MLDIIVALPGCKAGLDALNHLLPWLVQESTNSMPFGFDLSIESLRSRKFSIGIFVFLIISLVIFSVIIYIYLPKGESRLKTGEKIMFGAIIMGMVIAVIMGYIQLIEGYLL